jgi:hypothetical protein
LDIDQTFVGAAGCGASHARSHSMMRERNTLTEMRVRLSVTW